MNNQQIIAVVGYIIPVLFFVPLLQDQQTTFSRFHANQQLVLLLAYVAVSVFAHSLLFFHGPIYLLVNLAQLALFGLGMFGAYHAYHDRMTLIPFLGNIKILK